MITATQYQNIICSLDTALTAQYQCFQSLLSMRQTLNRLHISDLRSNALGFPIDSLLTSLANQTGPSLQMQTFLKNLQKHVDQRYGLNDFLNDNAIMIPQQVAALSAKAGYVIPADRVGPCEV